MTSPRRRTLLLAEDIGLAPTLNPALAQQGWTVRATSSVREAIYSAQQQPIEAMVIALRLPDERGDVAFFRLAAQYPWLHSATLFLVHTETDRKVATRHAYPWAQLPTTTARIIQAIADVCGTPHEKPHGERHRERNFDNS